MIGRCERYRRVLAGALAAVALVLTGCTEELERRSFPPNEDLSGAPTFSILQLLQAAQGLPETDEETGEVTQESVYQRLLEGLEETGLRSTLEGEGPFTLFAPDNAAFARLPESVELTADRLRYHVVPGAVMLEEAQEAGTVATLLAGEGLTVQAEEREEGEDDSAPTRWIVNGVVRVAASNVPATNGLVNSVDGVLFPGNTFPGTVAEALQAYPAFETFTTFLASVESTIVINGVEESGTLLELLTRLGAAADISVFAPTERAWEGLLDEGTVTFTAEGEPELSEEEYASRLGALLVSHWVAQLITQAQLEAATTATPFPTPSTEFPNLTVRAEADGTVFLNEDADPETKDPRVTWKELKCTDGVIHVIDSVLNAPVIAEEVAP